MWVGLSEDTKVRFDLCLCMSVCSLSFCFVVALLLLRLSLTGVLLCYV